MEGVSCASGMFRDGGFRHLVAVKPNLVSSRPGTKFKH